MIMNNKPKSSNVNDLLAAIQRKAPTNPTPEPVTVTAQPTEAAAVAVANVEPEPSSRATRRTVPVERKTRVGKPVQFWLHDEDRRLVRELAAWLAGQGFRSTDSLIIRAALRTAKTGGELLNAYREAAQLDGRLKQHKAS
jgi:hypothetical protein